ncbi:MAG: class I SAM-dependent methyltransferase [Gaiellaceae bacterium]
MLAVEAVELAGEQIVERHRASQSTSRLHVLRVRFGHDDPALVMNRDLVADTVAAERLGTTLRRAGYTDDAIHSLLGEDAYSIERGDARAEERRLPDGPLATLVRLLFLQLSVSAEDAEAALGREAVAALEAIGLAEIGERVVPRARILPIGKVLLASDGYSQDEDDPSDYVATYTPTARVLDSLTPRPRIDSALDVGTGSGIHALLAAQHARRVIATDVNRRALAYTELNAALNGLRNIETRQGSLFEPVEGETFDLITCNAPYVVSPERRWVYRDSEFQDDQVSERVILLAAEHLNEGGYASMLVSWLAFDEKDPDERVRAWVEASGCDSWVLPTVNSDPLTHAAEWNSHLAGAALDEALDEWAQYFDALGVQLVSEGAVVLHKQDAGALPTIHIDELDEDDLDDAGDQILRAFEARATLATIGSDNALLEARVGVASSLRLSRDLEPSGGRAVDVEGTVELTDGTNHAIDATADVQEVIASLDSRMRLGEVLATTSDRLGLLDDEVQTLRDEALESVRALLELGALRFRGD